MKGRGEYHERLAKKSEYKILENIEFYGALWNDLLKKTGLSKSTLSKTLRRLMDRRVLEKRSPPFVEKKELGDFVEEEVAWELRQWIKDAKEAMKDRKRWKAILRYHKHLQPKHIKRLGESPREYIRRIRRETKPRYMFRFQIAEKRGD